MRKAGIIALSLGLVCGGLAQAQQPQMGQMPSAESKMDQPRSLIEAVGWRKRCCQSGECTSAAMPPAATTVAPGAPMVQVPAGQMPPGGMPMYGPPAGHMPGGSVAGPDQGEKRSLLGKGFHWSGNYPSWAWRCKPPPPPPPPEVYPGISWHRYPRSPRDFFMIEP
jgi:hypothetical protein